jgi:uncharacterized protein (TIGR00661 family)
MQRRRIFFIVQGEGRGHMTQALALQEMLASGGHEVVGGSVGVGRPEDVPVYFKDGFQAPLTTHPDQSFVRDRRNEGIRLGQSIAVAAVRSPFILGGLKMLDRHVRESGANVILNLYDPVGSLYIRFYRPTASTVVVGHQFLMQHPSFEFAAGKPLSRLLLRFFNAQQARGMMQRWALSYYQEPDIEEEGLFVLPPVLRRELFQLPKNETGEYLLVYMLNAGYLKQLAAWHARNSEHQIHCFCRRPGEPDTAELQKNLTVHQLSDNFLRMMARARAVVCTAGFEAVGEALYLGKPVYMIPTAHHYEQWSNAHDAMQRGVALTGDSFDLDPFLDYMEGHDFPVEAYRRWVSSAQERALAALEKLP